MGRLICIGDVHGCIRELDALVTALALSPGDRLVFLGDLVDRGPDPMAVVRRVRSLIDEYPGSTVVLGNHEAKMGLRIRNPARPDRPAWLQAANEHELTWLTQVPAFTRDRTRGVVMVHGGIFPRYFEHHGTLPEDPSELPSLSRKQRERIARFRMVRFVNEAGDFVSLRERTASARFWADVYDGREGLVLFGHEPYLEGPRRFEHAIGIDGGCVYGGALLAAVWNGTGAAEPHIVRQQAFERYAEHRPYEEDDGG